MAFFQSFLQHIAWGSAAVLALLLVTWLGTPRRSFAKLKRGSGR